MVDIGADAKRSAPLNLEGTAVVGAAETLVEVSPLNDNALSFYRDFCEGAARGIPQHPLWTEAWFTASRSDAIVISIRRQGTVAFMLVLEVVKAGLFTVAHFPSGGHANGNFIASGVESAVTSDEFAALRAAVAKARPDIDLLHLERQKPVLCGRVNPLSDFATTQSPNISLATDLSEGFEALLDRMSGKRKRKKFRLQQRRLEAAGQHRWFKATTPEEVDRLISAFYALKAARFRKRGIPDVFASPEVQAFFRKLFLDSLAHKPAPFELYGLEVAGELYNVKGFSKFDGVMVSEFCAMRDDEELGLSPGFYLDYLLMEQAHAEAVAIYDFSVGDEEYKRSWCELETWLFDITLPLSLKGQMLAGYKRARARLVYYVKNNKRLWALAKRLRTKVAGAQSSTD
jgi:CelD/BcsL family acetyltransferase involved in cellulose biosynthesis